MRADALVSYMYQPNARREREREGTRAPGQARNTTYTPPIMSAALKRKGAEPAVEEGEGPSRGRKSSRAAADVKEEVEKPAPRRGGRTLTVKLTGASSCTRQLNVRRYETKRGPYISAAHVPCLMLSTDSATPHPLHLTG